MTKEEVELWLFNNIKRPIHGHMVGMVWPSWWCGFGYETKDVCYRNWHTTDFVLRLGFCEISGWIPENV